MFAWILAAFLISSSPVSQIRSPQAKLDAAAGIESMITAGQFANAEAAARALVDEIDADNGNRDSVELAEALSVLMDCFYRTSRRHDPWEHSIADRAVAVGQRLFTPGDRHMIEIRRRAANLLFKDEDFRAARAILEDVTASLDRVPRGTLPPGFDSLPDFLHEQGQAWSDLGETLHHLSDNVPAKAAYEKALSIFHERGIEDREMAIAYNNLALVYGAADDPETAIKLYSEAMSIYEKTEGPDSPLVAGCLNNLGKWLNFVGRRAEAEQMLRRSLDIALKTYGPDNFRSGHAAGNLASTLLAEGDYPASERMWEQSRDIYERSSGPNHPYYAIALNGLAGAAFRQGRIRESVELSLRADRVQRDYLDLTIPGVPEREALLQAARGNGTSWAQMFGAALTYLLSDPTPDLLRAALDEEIRDRAVVFEEMAARSKAAVNSSDPEVARLADTLARARERLSQVVVKGPAGASKADFAARVDAARRVKYDAEAALAQASAPFMQQVRRNRIGLDEVAASIAPGEALVTYVEYRRITEVFNRPVESYVAFVLRGGEPVPRMVPLGDSASIDALIRTLRKQVLDEAQSGGRAPKLSEAAYRRTGDELRGRIWDPLSQDLSGIRRVFIVADGQLNLTNLAALPVGKDSYLIERGPVLHYLSSERDIVRDTSPVRGEGLLAMGGWESSAPEHASLRGSLTNCASFQSLQFDPLPGSETEVRQVASIWNRGHQGGVAQRTGTTATKVEFLRLAPGKRILHLAVHGFYLGGCGNTAAAGNPLLLSGLAFTGKGAGILTAEEILPLDLRGVEWAVLSGCDTGVGDVQTGEGTFGLQRAFELAGVRTVILSLWPVEDDGAREWMQALYDARFLQHRDTAESTRQASLTVLNERRKNHLSTHPFHWAGFVATGDWH